MASLSFLLLSAALIHAAQALPAARGGGRGLEVSGGGVRRQRRDIRKLLPYEEQMTSYQAAQGGGGADHLYYQSDGWGGRGLDQALQRLVQRDQRQEQEEEQRAAYLSAVLRLLSEAQSAGLIEPGDMEVEEEEEEEEDQGPPDYDETGRGLNMGRPPAAWWGLLDRMEPQVAQALLERARPQQAGRGSPGRGGEQDSLRRLVARLLSGRLSLTAAQPVSSAHRRSRRSLDESAPPSPSNDPPLLRVKRLEEEELRPPPAGLEKLHHGSRRRRRRDAPNYNPQILIDQILEYMRE